MTFNIYKKGLRKGWLMGLIPPSLIALFIFVIAGIWPELKDQISALEEILDSPFYKAFLGALVDLPIGEWYGMFVMYIFMFVEYFIIILAIFIPTRIITGEVDKNTLDTMLSLPVPRWRFILEKYFVFLTYNLFYIIILLPASYIATEFIAEELNYLYLLYSLIGVWFLFFTLGSISLLCAALVLETSKAFALSGALILGQYILLKIAGLTESLHIFRNLSMFNYLGSPEIFSTGAFPIGDLIVVLAVGIIALISALYVFEKKDLSY